MAKIRTITEFSPEELTEVIQKIIAAMNDTADTVEFTTEVGLILMEHDLMHE